MNIPFPSRYLRAQIFLFLGRVYAVFIFLVSVLIASGLLRNATIDDDGFFGDTIARVTGDRIDNLVIALMIVSGFLTLVGGTYLAYMMYAMVNTLSATLNIEKDVEVIKNLAKKQVGVEADAIEDQTLEQLHTAVLTIERPSRRLFTVGVIIIFLCAAISLSVALLIPETEEAPGFEVAEDCEVGDSSDSDCDGISNDLETWVAETYMPVYVYDVEERNILLETDDIVEFRDVVYLHQVSAANCGRIAGLVEDTVRNDLLLTIVASYTYDYIPLGIHTEIDELDVLDHFGDTERTRICIDREVGERPTDSESYGDIGSIAYEVALIQINRHAQFTTYRPDEMILEDGTHPYLYISEGKHASYVSAEECAAHPRDITALAFREDCSSLEEGRIVRPNIAGLNVGQVDAQLIRSTEELPGTASTMFELGEQIWQDIQFCGGYPPDTLIETSLTAQVQTFLEGSDSQLIGILNTMLPFVGVETEQFSEVCGGSLYSKWWVSAERSEELAAVNPG